MGIMNWSDALDIGVQAMNDEHKGLLDLMNKLFDLHTEKASKTELQSVLDQLKTATVTHFQHEETYMQKISWEGLPTHQHIHKTLLDNFGKHYARFSEDGKLSDEFFHFLKFWLSAHIQGIDKKYGDFSKQRKKAG